MSGSPTVKYTHKKTMLYAAVRKANTFLRKAEGIPRIYSTILCHYVAEAIRIALSFLVGTGISLDSMLVLRYTL